MELTAEQKKAAVPRQWLSFAIDPICDAVRRHTTLGDSGGCHHERYYLSPHRPIGEDSNFNDELKDAQILRNLGSTVYLVPEQRRRSGKKFDAVVNGLKFEFKNIGGNANTLAAHFLKSRSQAPNVFINLETSNLTRREVMGSLYSARNSVTHTDKNGNIIKGYAERNGFSGGRIILKLKGHKNLVYLNVDDLKARR